MYGSRARGDFHADSDVDLLGIMPEGALKGESEFRGVNIHLTPFKRLLAIAGKGDLFAGHIVHEGKPLYNSMETFERIRNAFKWKQNYNRERAIASLIIQYLTSLPMLSVRSDLIKRLTWAIRTLIIASAAEERQVAYSADALANFADMKELRLLLENRNSVKSYSGLILAAGQISERFGLLPPFAPQQSIAAMEVRLARFGGIAAATVYLANGKSQNQPPDLYE